MQQERTLEYPAARRSLTFGLVAIAMAMAGGCSTLPSGGTQQAKSKQIIEQEDAPEISRSVGSPGGVLVLWPRIIPASEDAETVGIARRVQARLVELAGETLPDRPLDVRPDPERVCPKDGCDAMTLGAVITRKGDKCAVVALVSGSGQSPAQIVRWAAEMQIRQERVPFREPPESALMITDYASCSALDEAMETQTPAVVEAIENTALGE